MSQSNLTIQIKLHLTADSSNACVFLFSIHSFNDLLETICWKHARPKEERKERLTALQCCVFNELWFQCDFANIQQSLLFSIHPTNGNSLSFVRAAKLSKWILPIFQFHFLFLFLCLSLSVVFRYSLHFAFVNVFFCIRQLSIVNNS